jgi:arylsulfatase A-like enzyme
MTEETAVAERRERTFGFREEHSYGGRSCGMTPNFEALAANGLRYNRFHTTALCSPTRQALLTGRNHHAVGMGGVTEIATSAPDYNSLRPNTAAPLAEMLKLNGYSTAPGSATETTQSRSPTSTCAESRTS